MIDLGDHHVGKWVNSIVKEAEVSFLPPSGQVPAKPTVNIYLFDLMPASVTRNNNRTPPLQIQLRYLVTTSAKDPVKAHKLLGDLVFAAMEHAEFDVDLEPLPATCWTALGIAPAPAFLLRMHIVREREQEAQRVRNVMDIKSSSLNGVNGVVVGPGEIPIANARVEFPFTGAATRTDSKGRFYLAAIPVSPDAREFLVQAKGKELSVTMKPKDMQKQPVVIHFDVLEA
ncbi:MAG: Pvc16 family protein [Pseudomonadota bacterium]